MKAKNLFEHVPYDPNAEPEPEAQGQGHASVSMLDVMAVIPPPVRLRIIALLKKHYPNYGGEISQLLRAELRPLGKQLGTVGLLPEYAAYLIPYYVYTVVGDVNEIDRLNEVEE